MKTEDPSSGKTNGLPKLKVAVIYSDARREYFPTEAQYITEAEVKGRGEVIAEYLHRLNVDAQTFPGNSDLSDSLMKYKPDFAINLVDSIYGQEHLQAAIPALLEMHRIPYTGTAMMGLVITTNKFFNKGLLEQYGLTTPKYQIVKDINDEIDPALDFPLITKLNETHGSLEIDETAVCADEKELEKRIEYLMKIYNQPVLVEEYVAGREITAIVLEGMNTKVYAAEKVFNPNKSTKYKIATFAANWDEDDDNADSIVYKKYELPEKVKESIKTAFDILKMDDYAKFDIRVDEAGRHYIIDCNANPAIGPKELFCSMGTILGLYDISFEEILTRIIKNTLNGNLKNYQPLVECK